MLIYFNNGTQFRVEADDNYVCQTGEKAYDIYTPPSIEQLTSDFPGYISAIAVLNTAKANIPILQQIKALEAKQARAVRDWILRADSTYVASIDTQIATLRATLQS
jgi:hypothetical protein